MNMALNEEQPERNSLSSTLEYGQSGTSGELYSDHGQKVDREPIGDPLEQKSTSTEMLSEGLQTTTNGDLLSSADSLKSHKSSKSPEVLEKTTFKIDNKLELSDRAKQRGLDGSTKEKSKVLVLIVKIVILSVLGIVIAGAISIPVTAFILNVDSESKASTGDECSAEVYSGEVCRATLTDRQTCIPGREDSSEILVQLSQSMQTIVEDQLSLLQQFVQPSPECGGDMLAFLCLEALSGFCDSTGAVHRASRQECERVTTITCEAEFLQILPLLRDRGIDLSCDDFPEESSVCDIPVGSGVEMVVPSSQPQSPLDNDTINDMDVQRNCSEGFFVDETSDLGLCTPECGEWWPQSATKRQAFDIVTITIVAVGVALTTVVVVLSCINYKTMFKFPGIFIFYQMLSTLLFITIFLVNYVDFKYLMCGSRSLVETLLPGNETPFCIILAASWIYVSHQVALWWIFHLSMIFFAIFWPFKYHQCRQSRYFKYIHIAMVLAGVILPFISVIICLKVDGYVLYFFIHPICVARNPHAAFYSHVLPLILTVAVGVYLLSLIFWKFFSEEWWPSSKKQDSPKKHVEIKILLLLLGYIIVWADIIGVTVATLIEAQDFANTLVNHFTCEAIGTEECSRQSFTKFDEPSKLIATFLVALYPGIFIIYFVKLSWCRKTKDTSVLNTSESALSSKNV